MKKISLLDEALFAYLEAQKAPNQFTWLLALIQWDNALFSAGVYRLAAQGEAAIRADPASFTEDRWTASVLAIFLTRSSSYNADVFLKLSQANTFNDRQAIRMEAGDGVHSLTSLELYHQQVAKLYEKEVNKAETRAREADRELDKKAKLATIKLAEAIPAKMAQQAKPAAKTRRRGGVTQKEAAKICGVTVFTIRAWDRGRHTPEGYPGREDAVTLKAWAGRKAEGEKLKAVVTGATRYGDIDRVSHKAERKGGYR